MANTPNGRRIFVERGNAVVTELITKSKNFYIYGAQVVAYGAFNAILRLTGKKPTAFLVSSLTQNPRLIDGIAVTTPEAADPAAPIIVAVTELLQNEIATSLKAQGFSNLFLLNAHEEHLLMSAYFADMGKFPLLDPMLERRDPPDFALYEICNHRDKPLTAPPNLRPFEHPLQAGAALTDKRIAALTDDTGENISAKNKQYCEMSAVYWVWKNTTHDWIGIEHYRRHLLVKPSMLTEDVDAILPLPYICRLNTLTQFRRFVSEDVLTVLLQTLREMEPRMFERYLSVLRDRYQYTYNLLCAKRSVFDDYCAWFFRITGRMEEMGGVVPEIGETRALSYVAEVLTNLYFMSRQNVLNLRHAEKAIFV